MNATHTLTLHADIMASARKIFQAKKALYGNSWELMDVHYIANRMMVKCERITRLLSGHPQQVEEDIPTELIDIINYAIIGLMQIKRSKQDHHKTSSDEAIQTLYDTCVAETTTILKQKNNDYNDAWRKMHYTSLLTQIKVKLSRVLNEKLTSIQENPTSTIDQYQDIVNYAVFMLLHPQAPHKTQS